MAPSESVSLLHEEKFFRLVDYLQQFALLRIISQQWPWPPFWRRWTRFSVLFLYDFPAYERRDRDDYSQDAGVVTPRQNDGVSWPAYGALWMLFVSSLVGYALFMIAGARRTTCSRRCTYITARLVLVAAEISYFPAAVGLPRLYGCVGGSSRPVYDTAVNEYTDHVGRAMFRELPTCASVGHIASICIATLITLPYIIGFPLLLWYMTRRQLIYDGDVAHEMFLRSRELESLLGINDSWRSLHYYSESHTGGAVLCARLSFAGQLPSPYREVSQRAARDQMQCSPRSGGIARTARVLAACARPCWLQHYLCATNRKRLRYFVYCVVRS
jgi:hypothetical protein